MKSFFTLVMLLWARWLVAQSPGDSLLDVVYCAWECEKDPDYICAQYRKLRAAYPVTARNAHLGMLIDCIENDSAEVAARNLCWEIYYQHDTITLQNCQQPIKAFLAGYPASTKYNDVRALYASLLDQAHAYEMADSLWNVLLDESMQVQVPSRNGFFAARNLAMRAHARGEFEASLAITRLTLGKLHDRPICHNDYDGHAWTLGMMGLCYAGLGKTDSALYYLSQAAFAEYAFTRDAPFLAIDSLLAQLQRMDTTPLMEQLEAAVDDLHYQDLVDTLAGHATWHQMQAWLEINGVKIPFLKMNDVVTSTGNGKGSFAGRSWTLPLTREDCIGLLRETPFYLRAKGVATAEMYPWW